MQRLWYIRGNCYILLDTIWLPQQSGTLAPNWFSTSLLWDSVWVCQKSGRNHGFDLDTAWITTRIPEIQLFFFPVVFLLLFKTLKTRHNKTGVSPNPHPHIQDKQTKQNKNNYFNFWYSSKVRQNASDRKKILRWGNRQSINESVWKIQIVWACEHPFHSWSTRFPFAIAQIAAISAVTSNAYLIIEKDCFS